MATDFKCNLPFLAVNNVNTNKALCTNQSDVAGSRFKLYRLKYK